MTEDELKQILTELGIKGFEVTTKHTSRMSQRDIDVMRKITSDWFKWLSGAIDLCEMADCEDENSLINIVTVAFGEGTRLAMKIGLDLKSTQQAVEIIYKREATRHRKESSK